MKHEPSNPNELRELSGLLSRLPDAPVASNFTARVMQAIELEEVSRSREKHFFGWNWRALLPRVAVAAVVLVSGFAFYQHEIYSQRAELARSVAQLAAASPGVEALQNFDAIRRMSQPAHADTELLALADNLK
jgi:anti-sigma-K factor RskA